MTRLGLALAALVAAGCDARGTSPTQPIAGQITRPTIISPAYRPAAFVLPQVSAPALTPVRLIEPIVRGPGQIDAYIQEEAVVDVLFIVDNSASVSNERERLALEFDRFLTILIAGGVDFHVGVTSTDLQPTGDGGRLRLGVIDRTTPRPRDVFRRAVQFPLDVEIALEEGLAAMVAALTPPLSETVNRGLLRPEAALAVIVVSDEDDGSLGTVGFYSRVLRGLKGPGREVDITLSAVVGERPEGCVTPGEEAIFGAGASAGDRYIELAEATGGVVESICAPDFAPFVERLATRLAGLRRVFVLSAPPKAGTLVVRVDGAVISADPDSGFTYDEANRAVVFAGSYVPPPGAEVEIDYALDV